MASNDPHPPGSPAIRNKNEGAISAEDAELFASRIRPSWELIDESMRSSLEAELAATPPNVPSDTIIDGVKALPGAGAPPPGAAAAKVEKAEGASVAAPAAA